jgi:alpha-D-xyloside xylohydrolase
MKRWQIIIMLTMTYIIVGCSDYSTVPTQNGIIINLSDAVSSVNWIKMTVRAPGTVEIIKATSDSPLWSKSLIVDEYNYEEVEYRFEERKNYLELFTSELRVVLDITTGSIYFYDLSNELLLSEQSSEIKRSDDTNREYYHIMQEFIWKEGEAHYGLGQHEGGVLNYRGNKVELVQKNTKVAVPFLISTEGYGLFWDNYSRTVYDDTNDNSYLWSEEGDNIRYTFIYGPDFDRIGQRYHHLTGEVPMYPKWAFGFIQSRNRYWNRNELVEVVRRYRRERIPLDVIVLDYFHWEENGFGSFTFHQQSFPEPEKMIQELHEDHHVKIMVSLWPSFSVNSPNWSSMKERGYLLDAFTAYNSQVYDAYNPAARDLYWELMRTGYLDIGVDALWFDATEPENIERYLDSNSYIGNLRRYLNTYSLVHTKNIYTNLVTYNNEKRPFILTRSAFPGQQQYGTTVWSGDIGVTFESLRMQIPAGLNFTAAGIPYWTTDIGGYNGGDPDDPTYREVYIRWFQYGTFCPIFRTHGRRYPGDRRTPNEIWSYGQDAQSILTDYIRLRYRLLPYIYSLSARVSNEGYTIMRNLAYDFRGDREVFDIKDQFMFGDAMMINPVIESDSRQRSVYLPDGAGWYDFWSGEFFEGGQTIIAAAPIETIPVYIQSGSIIPLGPDVQYATEKEPDPIEIRIFTGSDGTFTLYEDEFEGHDYKRGVFATIDFDYDDKKMTLRIGERQGAFPGMLEKRTFHIVIVKTGHGTGIDSSFRIDKTVIYSGDEIHVCLE